MFRTFRYPLLPTKKQALVLEAWCRSCCELYNAALQERRDAWRKQHVRISYYDQQKELTELRAADSDWRDVPVYVARSALTRLDRAFAGFFRRVSAGKRYGFPRFRPASLYDSFDLGSNIPRIEGNRVSLPKLGAVRFHKYRPISGEIRLVRVKRDIRGWAISFVCDVGAAPAKHNIESAAGIDVGLSSFATLSTGETVANPRFARRAEYEIAKKHSAVSAKRRGSASRIRAQKILAVAYRHVRNRRLDFCRQLAANLVTRFDLLVHENLDIPGMISSCNGVLAKSICDASWGLFLRCLALKAESAGKHVVAVDSRGTSQICPGCGVIEPKALKQRTHECGCGYSTSRDHASAQMILARGLRAGLLTEASIPCKTDVVALANGSVS